MLALSLSFRVLLKNTINLDDLCRKFQIAIMSGRITFLAGNFKKYFDLERSEQDFLYYDSVIRSYLARDVIEINHLLNFYQNSSCHILHIVFLLGLQVDGIPGLLSTDGSANIFIADDKEGVPRIICTRWLGAVWDLGAWELKNDLYWHKGSNVVTCGNQ